MRPNDNFFYFASAIGLAACLASTSPARAAAWQLVDGNSRAQVEVDVASVVRKDGAATGWVQHTYSRQTSSQSGAYFAYRSMKEQLRMNCSERVATVLARAYFNDDGGEIAMIKGKGESRPVTPDSTEQRILTRMCNPAAANAAVIASAVAANPAGRYMDAPIRSGGAAHGFVKANIETQAVAKPDAHAPAQALKPAVAVSPGTAHAAANSARAPAVAPPAQESRKDVVRRVQRQRGITPADAAAAADAGHAPDAASASDGHDAHWAYEGEFAPYRWGDLKSGYALCKSGARQSPIDIRNPVVSDVEPIQFHYEDAPLKVSNNGHTIEVEVAPGSFILHAGARYELVQFHFHTPSEERINGRTFDMVAHLVHKSAQGRLAVVAVLLTAGREQATLQQIWSAMPGTANRTRERLDVMINAAKLLPADPAFYSFMGSLTTPPCTEGVQWLVMKTPVEISREQISHFAALYPMNARPLQASNDRLIKAGK